MTRPQCDTPFVFIICYLVYQKQIVNLQLLDNWNVAQLGYLWKNQGLQSCKKMMNETDFQISQIQVLKTQETIKQLPRKKQEHVKRVRGRRTSYLHMVWRVSHEKKMVETIWAWWLNACHHKLISIFKHLFSQQGSEWLNNKLMGGSGGGGNSIQIPTFLIDILYRTVNWRL